MYVFNARLLERIVEADPIAPSLHRCSSVPHVDLSDHVHQLATEDDQLVGVCDFDYSEVDRGLGWAEDKEDMVSLSDCAAALSLVIEHCLQAKNLTLVGAKLAALAIYLDPVNNSKFGRTLSEIASNAGVTRAALSKALMNFRDEASIKLGIGKLGSSRQKYRDTQIKCLEAGRHSSFTRKDLKSKRK